MSADDGGRLRDKFLGALNCELLALDPGAMHALVEHRVPCTAELEAAGVPVASRHPDHGGGSEVGMLGVLGFLYRALTGGTLTAVFDDAGGQERLIAFVDERFSLGLRDVPPDVPA